jgi:hypothetical protein
MSRKDAILLASRTLAVLLTVWALTEVSYLPERWHAFLHYINQEVPFTTATQHLRHHYLIELGFLVTRIVGYSLVARWLYKGSPEVEELCCPPSFGRIVLRAEFHGRLTKYSIKSPNARRHPMPRPAQDL